VKRRLGPAAIPMIVLLTLSACGRTGDSGRERAPQLRPVQEPDLSKMSGPVQSQMRARFAALTDAAERHTTERADAYGAVGELLLAARYLEAAEPALLNARELAPRDPRWPYYLAHLYRMRGALDEAAASFREVLTLQPDDTAARIWLASISIDRGRADEAAPLLEAVLRRDPQSTAALFHLGRLALARRDFPRAVSLLETAARQDRMMLCVSRARVGVTLDL